MSGSSTPEAVAGVVPVLDRDPSPVPLGVEAGVRHVRSLWEPDGLQDEEAGQEAAVDETCDEAGHRLFFDGSENDFTQSNNNNIV